MYYGVNYAVIFETGDKFATRARYGIFEARDKRKQKKKLAII